MVLGVESVVVEAQVVEWVEFAYYYKKLDVQWNAVHSSKIAVAFQLFEAVKDCLVDVLPLEDLLSLLLLSSVETALIVWDLETVRDSPGDAVQVLAEVDSVEQSEEHLSGRLCLDLAWNCVEALKAQMAQFHSFQVRVHSFVAVMMLPVLELIDAVPVSAAWLSVHYCSVRAATLYSAASSLVLPLFVHSLVPLYFLWKSSLVSV